MGNSKQTAKKAAAPSTNAQLLDQIRELQHLLDAAAGALVEAPNDLWTYEIANARTALGGAAKWAKQIPVDVEQRALAVF